MKRRVPGIGSFLVLLAAAASSAFGQMPQDYWYQVGAWEGYGTNDGQFSSPFQAAAGTNGLVFVADTGNHRIQVFQSEGPFVRKWGSAGTNEGQFSSPRGVAVDASNRLYVADNGNNRIQVFEADGTFVRTWGSYGSADGQFGNPWGISVATNGLVYVADTGNHRIQAFQSDGTFVRKWGKIGTSDDGTFYMPGGVVAAPSGLIHVTDVGGHRLQIFQPDGTFVRKWGGYGFDNGQFVAPRGVAVGRDGLVYVGDARACRIQIFDPNGVFVRTIENVGWYQDNESPGVYSDMDGRLYVADVQNHRIKVYRRGYRAPGAGMPLPEVTAVTQRVGAATVDLDFTVWDDDSSNVQVAALGFSEGGASLNNLVRLDTLLEGTSNNLGSNVAANVPHRLTWDAGADWKVSYGNIQFEILANDGRPLVDFHFITIPSNGPDPELTIERFPMKEADFQTCWYWLIATRDAAVEFRSNKVYGASGSYTNQLLAEGSSTTAAGRTFLYERLQVREATTDEVNRARLGTAGVVNQWAPRYPTDRRGARNEFGFDTAYTQGAGAWYVVPLP